MRKLKIEFEGTDAECKQVISNVQGVVNGNGTKRTQPAKKKKDSPIIKTIDKAFKYAIIIIIILLIGKVAWNIIF